MVRRSFSSDHDVLRVLILHFISAPDIVFPGTRENYWPLWRRPRFRLTGMLVGVVMFSNITRRTAIRCSRTQMPICTVSTIVPRWTSGMNGGRKRS